MAQKTLWLHTGPLWMHLFARPGLFLISLLSNTLAFQKKVMNMCFIAAKGIRLHSFFFFSRDIFSYFILFFDFFLTFLCHVGALSAANLVAFLALRWPSCAHLGTQKAL